MLVLGDLKMKAERIINGLGVVMKKNVEFLVMGLCVIHLTACQMHDDREYIVYQPDAGEAYRFYPQANYSLNDAMNYKTVNQSNQGVEVPDSYHVSAYHSPVSFKDRDKNWVSNQNPQGYTIELADDEQAALVAQKLYKTPKNDRMAQVPYQRQGKLYYKGLYGSYESQEAAQKALDSLPPEVRRNAGVKNWSSVQNHLNE